MNKKYLLITTLAAMTLGSCDMDKEPYDSLIDTEALNTPINFQAAAVSLYSGMKSSIMGTFYNAPEIQCDGFHAVTGFSNTLGEMYRWTFNSQTSEIGSVYGNYQALIARANFIIDGYNKADLSNENIFPEKPENVDNNPGLPAVEKAVGEAYFMRAYSLFNLTQYFCAAYDPATADNEHTGVSYRLDYAPSQDPSTYPGRKTLAETYTQIYADLDEAAKHITLNGSQNNAYVSIDAITALRARVALAQGNYELAKQEAEILIGSGEYTLASNETQLKELWTTSATWEGKGGNETILLLVMASTSELPLQTGDRYQPYQSGAIPDYIPTQTLMDLYSDNDYRKNVYFNKVDITTTTGGSGNVYALNKYEREGILYRVSRSESGYFAIEPRVFRIAEMYLIAAEAWAQCEESDLTQAAFYLNRLQSRRIRSFRNQTYPDKETFMAELMNERQRELLVEGARLFDIKRWHLPMRRGEAQQRDLCLLPGSETTDLSIPANSDRLTWPIPKHEMDVNPQIKQNPGY